MTRRSSSVALVAAPVAAASMSTRSVCSRRRSVASASSVLRTVIARSRSPWARSCSLLIAERLRWASPRASRVSVCCRLVSWSELFASVAASSISSSSLARRPRASATVASPA